MQPFANIRHRMLVHTLPYDQSERKQFMTTLAKQDLLQAGLAALGREGISGVRVERLAAALGVTKGSFYHHFSKRQELLDGILTFWAEVATEQIISNTNAASGAPRERLLILALNVFSESGNHDQIEWAIRQWAVSSEEVAQAVASVDSRRIGYVRSLLEESGISPCVAEGRAHLMYRALVGEYTWRQHGGVAMTQDALRDMVVLLLQGQGQPSPDR